MTCPCKGCKDRYVGCHSKCDGYICYQKENEEKREARAQANDFEYGFIDRELNIHYKLAKRRHIR